MASDDSAKPIDVAADSAVSLPIRSNGSNSSIPPPGQTLTGKQEHCSYPFT
jgi:hypothetical protein